MLIVFIQVRQDKVVPRTSVLPTDPVDAQVVVVGATLPKELVDALQDMLPVRTRKFWDASTLNCLEDPSMFLQ